MLTIICSTDCPSEAAVLWLNWNKIFVYQNASRTGFRRVFFRFSVLCLTNRSFIFSLKIHFEDCSKQVLFCFTVSVLSWQCTAMFDLMWRNRVFSNRWGSQKRCSDANRHSNGGRWKFLALPKQMIGSAFWAYFGQKIEKEKWQDIFKP